MAYFPPDLCLCMKGERANRFYRDPQDYRFWGNREYATDPTGNVFWVRLFVSWESVQGGLGAAPASIDISWDQANTASPSADYVNGQRQENVPLLQKLDRQIRQANEDGIGVILCVGNSFPPWAGGATAPEPVTGKTPNYRFPTAVGSGSPWSWFIAHLCARYTFAASVYAGRAPNPYGPHRTPKPGENPVNYSIALGNPSGGYADFIEFVNEPNHILWPQSEAPSKVAAMFWSTYAYAKAYGGPDVLGPATLDRGGDTATPPYGTNYQPFTDAVLTILRNGNFRPTGIYVGWSQHNYGDVKYKLSYSSSRVRTTKISLASGNWKGIAEKYVYLTEGGYDMSEVPSQQYRLFSAANKQAALATQLDDVVFNVQEMDRYNQVVDSDDIYLVTQYGLHDIFPDTFESGLREDFRFDGNGQSLGPGAKRPLHDRWLQLP